jgi:hypothetical protein
MRISGAALRVGLSIESERGFSLSNLIMGTMPRSPNRAEFGRNLGIGQGQLS